MLNYLFGPESTFLERALAVLAGLLLACAVLITCAALTIATVQATQDNQTTHQAATATGDAKAATRQAQATATQMPAPTVTRVPMWAVTREATVSIEQAPTLTAQVSAADVSDLVLRDYLIAVEVQGGLIEEALISLGDLTANPRQFDSDWRADIAFHAGTISAAHEIMSNETSPPQMRMREFHRFFTGLTRVCSQSAKQLTEGVNMSNEVLLRTANLALEDCLKRVEQFDDELDRALVSLLPTVAPKPPTPTSTRLPTFTPASFNSTPAQ